MRQKSIALVLLAVLAGLPVSSVVCLARCEMEESPRASEGIHTGHHHGGGTNSPLPGAPAREALRGLPGHDCFSHDGIVRDSTEALAAGRAGATVLASVADHCLSGPGVLGLTALRECSGYSPPQSASRTRAPIVLRI